MDPLALGHQGIKVCFVEVRGASLAGKCGQRSWARFHVLPQSQTQSLLGVLQFPGERGVVPNAATPLPWMCLGLCGAPRLRMFPEELAEASLNRNRITCFINVLIKLKCIYYFLLFLVE